VAFVDGKTRVGISHNGGWLGSSPSETLFLEVTKRTLIIAVTLSFFGTQINRAATSLFPGPDYIIPGAPPEETGPATGPQGLTSYPGTMWQRALLLGDVNDLRNQILNHGFSFSPVLIGEVMGNVSGGMERGVIFDGVLNLGMDVDLERLTDWWTGGSIHANALWIYGSSLSAQYVGDISNTSNIAGYNTFRLQELWFEQSFWLQRASLRVGMLAADAEFFTSAYSSLFLSGTFGAFTFVGSNLPNPPVYPEAVPGIRLAVQPVSKFFFQAAIYDGNGESQVQNNHGVNFRLSSTDGTLIFSEVAFLLGQSPGDRGLKGTYKLGSFVHTANFSTWDSQAREALGTGSLKSAGVDYGVYGVIDQELIHSGGRSIGMFVRAGDSPSDVNFVHWYVDGGFNFKGFIPGRNRDIAGIAVSHSSISKDFSNAQVLQGNPGFSSETVLEATYNYSISPWWTVQPDFQYIWNPSAQNGSQDAAVIGLRTTISF
jgi:porin